MDKRQSIIIVIAAVVAILAGGAGGYGWYWSNLADGLKANVAVWLGQRRAQGYLAEAPPMRISGFPFEVVGKMAHAELGRGDIEAPAVGQPSPWHWRGERLQVRLDPLNPWRAELNLKGKQKLSFVDQRGVRQDIDGKAESARGVVEFYADGKWSGGTADIRNLQLTSAQVEKPLTVAQATFSGKSGEMLTLSTQLDGVALPIVADPVLGESIELLRLDVSLSNPLPTGWTRSDVTGWRDDGGVVEIARARLKWGTLDLTVAGTLALDAALRPQASGTAKLRGHAEVIAAYRENGMITAMNAAALTIALNVLGRDADGAVNIPVTVQEGRLKVGPMEIARLTPLTLPGD